MESKDLTAQVVGVDGSQPPSVLPRGPVSSPTGTTCRFGC